MDIEPRAATEDIVGELGCRLTSVENYLHKMDKVYKFGMWVPHELTEKILTQRILQYILYDI